LLENKKNLLSLFYQTKEEKKIIQKIQNSDSLNTFCEVSQGLIPYDKYRWHTPEQIKNRVFHSEVKIDESYKKELKWWDISRYSIVWNGKLYIKYWDWLAAPRTKRFFTEPRIVIREIWEDKLFASYTEQEYYNTPSIINILSQDQEINLKYILAILNSKMLWFYSFKTSPKASKWLFPKILVNDVRNFPIKKITLILQWPYIKKVDEILNLNKQFQDLLYLWLDLFTNKYWLKKISKKLQSFYELNFQDFKKQLKVKKLSLEDEEELLSYFTKKKTQLLELKAKIDATDREIDNMVFDLYGLTDEERMIILES